MDIKEKITQLRKERGWSLCKLARQAGITESAVYNWYNEKNYTPSRNAIEDICAAFEISEAEFFTDIEVDKLTEQQMLILELFDKVPESKKNIVIEIVRSFTK